ncbi:hypothetical protein GCM10023210_14530 [Chryseobacterium ginsengisoli]|uniref:Lipoprotein n=1 Tax=Chryseobacterium ginsengisoli TaxID=363853 RepID=A0ABP9M1G6_9FLAO
MKKIKHLLSVIAVAFFLIIAYGSDDNNKNESDKSSALKDIETTKTSEIPLKTQLQNSIKGLEKGNDLTENVQSIDGIVIVLALYKSYHITITKGKESKNKEEKDLAKQLENKVSDSQVQNFPKLRAIYYKLMESKLWEHDISVTVGGKRNTILNLTAGYFAANKNIKDTQETLNEMLTSLRFKQINYRWYKGEDEYTYYKIDSPKDSEVVE